MYLCADRPEIDKRLQEAFPAWKDFRPLKIGARDEILKFLEPFDYSIELIDKTIAFHVMHYKYLNAMTTGRHRHALDGAIDAELTEEESRNAFKRQEGLRRSRLGEQNKMIVALYTTILKLPAFFNLIGRGNEQPN